MREGFKLQGFKLQGFKVSEMAFESLNPEGKREL
jgi:hypothetical protein